MLIIIAGETAIGKSKVVYSIVGESDAIETNPERLEEDIREQITDKTEFIIIDEVLEKDLPKIKELKNRKELKIRKPYQNIVMVYEIPKIIIVTQDRIL